MHEIIPPDQIKSRLDALHISANQIAARAGLHHTTLSRIIGGQSKGIDYNTLVKLTAAIVAVEIELRDHLLALHPVDRPPQLEAAE